MSTKKYSARNKMYWLDKGFSEDESIKLSRSRMPGTFEYYTVFKGMTSHEAESAVQKFQANRVNNLENFTRKYGDYLGKLKWEEYKQKQAHSNSFEYKNKKYGWTIEQYNDYNKNRACTESNFIKRWGNDIGKQKWEDYCNQQSYTNSLDYFIKKYGNEDGPVRFKRTNFLKSHTMESYIERLGDVESAANAMKKYVTTFSSKCPYSRVADNFFDRLSKKLFQEFDDMIIFSHTTGKEWFIRDKNFSFFFVDFYVPKIKYVIEFNGDYWHANPSIYGADDIIQYPGLPMAASEIWSRDKERRDSIIQSEHVDTVDIVWESEFRNLDDVILTNYFNKIKDLYENQTNY
jgi:hypothetical protein